MPVARDQILGFRLESQRDEVVVVWVIRYHPIRLYGIGRRDALATEPIDERRDVGGTDRVLPGHAGVQEGLRDLVQQARADGKLDRANLPEIEEPTGRTLAGERAGDEAVCVDDDGPGGLQPQPFRRPEPLRAREGSARRTS